jgi:putative acetyltransferase
MSDKESLLPADGMQAAIRAMSIGDYERVHALWSGTAGMGLGESDTQPAVGAFLRRNLDMSAVAFAGGELVGAVLCGHDGRRGYLHHLAVSPGWRRRGAARQLLAWCFERLSARGIPKCNVFLFSGNAEGAAFWQHAGWSSRADLQVLQKRVSPPGPAAARS